MPKAVRAVHALRQYKSGMPQGMSCHAIPCMPLHADLAERVWQYLCWPVSSNASWTLDAKICPTQLCSCTAYQFGMQVIDPQSWDMMFERLRALPPSTRHVVMVTTVPVVYPQVSHHRVQSLT